MLIKLVQIVNLKKQEHPANLQNIPVFLFVLIYKAVSPLQAAVHIIHHFKQLP